MMKCKSTISIDFFVIYVVEGPDGDVQGETFTWVRYHTYGSTLTRAVKQCGGACQISAVELM